MELLSECKYILGVSFISSFIFIIFMLQGKGREGNILSYIFFSGLQQLEPVGCCIVC